MMTTSLHYAPFFVLRATTRDDRSKIVELAEEKSLYLDPDVCTKARNDLTISRNRLCAEISWLPGLSPNRASALLEALDKNINVIKSDTAIPSLAKANLLAAVFEGLDPDLDVNNWREWIIDFAYEVELIDSDDVLRDINADRLVSGFAEVTDTERIDEELEERRRYYAKTIREALDKLSPTKLVKVVTEVVEFTTESGEEHAPQLIHELVDRYEFEASRYLQPESENISKLIEAIRVAAPNGEEAIKTLVDKLDQIARKWDAVAQPIQLSKKAQGLNHQLSSDIAWAIRSLAVDLFNQHDMVSTVTRLTKTLQELFAELPEVSTKLEEDVDAIDKIIRDKQAAQNRLAEYEKEITYHTEIGLLYKNTLKISPAGIEWKGRIIALDAINKVRWGAVKHSINGIPTGTDYTIGISGTNESDFVITTRKGEIYFKFLDCLWKAVCVRLLEQYLSELKAGKSFSIGGVSFGDNGIYLTKHKFFSNETVYKSWDEVSYWSQNGSFFVGIKGDKKTYAEFPYLTTWNAHILEAIISLSFKNWNGCLSGFLK